MDVGCPKYCEEYPDDDKCEPIPKPPAEKDKKIKKFLLEDNECDFEQFNKREVLESYPNQEYLTDKELESRFLKKHMSSDVQQIQQIRNDIKQIISQVGEKNKDKNYAQLLRFKK